MLRNKTEEERERPWKLFFYQFLVVFSPTPKNKINHNLTNSSQTVKTMKQLTLSSGLRLCLLTLWCKTVHMFTLHCITDLFLSKKKRQYCLFVDYEQVFACVKRAFLRQKLLDSSVNGRILTVIKDMYQKAKSCVKVGDNCSDYFQCCSGVRQGEKTCHQSYLPFI